MIRIGYFLNGKPACSDKQKIPGTNSVKKTGIANFLTAFWGKLFYGGHHFFA